MYTMVMNFPVVQSEPAGRPRQCPNCDSTILQKWGRAPKPLKDLDHQQAEVHRYRCTDCRRTFRTYPPGIERSNRSMRLRAFAAFTWALGLSLDSVVDVFDRLGLEMSRTTIWRDGKNMPGIRREPTRDCLITLLGVDDIQLTSSPPPKWQFRSRSDISQKERQPTPQFIKREEITLILKLGQKHIFLGVVDIDGPHAAREWLQTLADDFGLESSVNLTPRTSRLIN